MDNLRNKSEMQKVIHTIHGTVKNWNYYSECHRLYVNENRFIQYLETLPYKYSRLDSVDKTPAMTIDDSTKAGAEACIIARDMGHNVTLFINPWQIISQTLYPINLLDFAIDQRKKSKIHINDKYFDLSNRNTRRIFRNLIKESLKVLRTEAAINKVATIFEMLNASMTQFPDFIKPITIDELLLLKKLNVNIENHGWSHLDISSLNLEELNDDIVRSQRWIFDQLEVKSLLYAVPFGKIMLPRRLQKLVKVCYLLDDKKPLGLNGKHWNRLDITSKLNQEIA